MNVTAIRFHEHDMDRDYMENLNGNDPAQFVLTVDGTDYTGMAYYDTDDAYGIEWDTAVPEIDGYAEEIVRWRDFVNRWGLRSFATRWTWKACCWSWRHSAKRQPRSR